MGGSGPGGVKEGLRQGLRARDLMRVEWEEKRGRGLGGDSAGWRLPPDLHCSSFLQIPEEVGLTWDPRSQAPSTPEPAPGARTTCTRAGRAWVAWGCWVDEWASTGRSAGVRWKGGRVGRPGGVALGGYGHAAAAPFPPAAEPLGHPAQSHAPAGPAACRPLALLRPPRREPPLPPAPRPLPGGAQCCPRGRRGRLHAAHLL